MFLEMYKAYKDGRSDKDPTEGWYEGEIGTYFERWTRFKVVSLIG